MVAHVIRWEWAVIGVVSQDPYVFDETIRFNILYGRSEATEEEVQESASRTYAEGFSFLSLTLSMTTNSQRSLEEAAGR